MRRTVAEIREALWKLAILTLVSLFVMDWVLADVIPYGGILPMVLLIVFVFCAAKFLRCPFCGGRISLAHRPCCPHCGEHIDP